jgi:hypothetical protein
LDLATAIAQVRQHEDVKKQQTVLRSSDSSAHMDAVMHNKYKKNNYKQKQGWTGTKISPWTLGWRGLL